MNPKAQMKAAIARMSNAQLVATFNEIDSRVVSQRQNPNEWTVRCYLCDELEARGISYAPEYDDL